LSRAEKERSAFRKNKLAPQMAERACRLLFREF
jgi:hypothetical protein